MTKMTLDELVAQLRAAFGAELRSVVLYGSAAAGDGGLAPIGRHLPDGVLGHSGAPPRAARVAALRRGARRSGRSAPAAGARGEGQAASPAEGRARGGWRRAPPARAARGQQEHAHGSVSRDGAA